MVLSRVLPSGGSKCYDDLQRCFPLRISRFSTAFHTTVRDDAIQTVAGTAQPTIVKSGGKVTATGTENTLGFLQTDKSTSVKYDESKLAA